MADTSSLVADATVVTPERDIARDLARRAVWVAPVFVVVGAIGWGATGAASSAIALALVVANFLIGAAIITRAVSISLNALYGAVLFGYLIRLGALAVIAVVLKGSGDWFAAVPFAITLLVTHLGLLTWETRHVSASLAFPGLMPQPVPQITPEENHSK
ncbi:MAG: ATP synthase subunit I [Acidimicrobiia bacterium]|nr:ATP synthase subunit I [Acidimicrobiia bacterium]